MATRDLCLVLGDQLDRRSALFDTFDRDQDRLWMAEVSSESTHVWTHKGRIALFLAAMRHFRDELVRDGLPLDYRQLDDPDNAGSLAAELQRAIARLQPRRLKMVQPGEWRVLNELQRTAHAAGVPLEVLPDRHFITTPEQFAQHARARKQLRLEYFYRELRRTSGVLMDGDQPEGGQWNFDAENRSAFGSAGPADVPMPRAFRPDRITRAVNRLVEQRFGDHPGQLTHFDWPVTASQAQQALVDFIERRLPTFGTYQDAMWTDQPYLYHSRLSAALNLKLLNPREVIQAAEAAYRSGHAPLSAVEGFIRQVLGWREYVRAVYWHFMPEYLQRNALAATGPLPDFYWTAETDLQCLQSVIQQTLQYGYAHHIQRLMVTGLFALLLGVEPTAVHHWYLAVYVDAVEWVELPNVLGMSQFADGGTMASKPYVASGKYIQRMSNYCQHCRYAPEQATGEQACPFTTLYWDFLMQHQESLRTNQRMKFQLANLQRKAAAELQQIREHAAQLRQRWH